jgi:hypothetical protein
MTMKKAKLSIILKADSTTVAEVEDPLLWQQVLAAIQQGQGATAEILGGSGSGETKAETLGTRPNSPIARLSKAIGVSQQELVGAMDPSDEAPYLHLDVHCWEAMKKSTPSRGPGAMSAAALAGTLLCLWFREAGLGHPTQGQALEALNTISVSDANASRGIGRAKWLQARSGGAIVLNPAQISQAIGIAKSFCLKKWNKGAEKEGTD